MKYSVQTYAEALARAFRDSDRAEHPAIVKRFGALLRKTGDAGAAGKIVRALERMLVAEDGGHWVTVETAREGSDLARISPAFSKKDRIESAVRPALIAGARITVDGERELDYSLARRIKKLFNAHP